MRYLAECPRCRTRLSRAAFWRRVECPGCRSCLRQNPIYDFGWSVVINGPGGVLIGLAVCGVVPWRVATAVTLIGVLFGYGLFPYISKFELADEQSDRMAEIRAAFASVAQR